MGIEKLSRGQIVFASFPNNCLGIIEFLKTEDGKILNFHDNVITGRGEKNTKLVAVVRNLYSIPKESYGYDSWNVSRIPTEYDGKTLIEVDPHQISVLSEEVIRDFENKWISKIKFLWDLFKHQPEIKEIDL